jgi:hypothetical protein
VTAPDALDFTLPDDVLRFVRTVDHPFHPTSVFPFEMAYFLFECARAGIGCIIECGRMHGYSTAVLAEYGARQGIRIVSIDFEADPEIARACRQRLASRPPVELVTGEAFRELPRRLRRERRPLALLVDGPKNDAAVYLSSTAAAFGTVRVVAHHNAYEPSFPHFCARFPDPSRPEGSSVLASARFAEFRAWELERTAGGYRDLGSSSLALKVLPVVGPDRRYLRGATGAQTLRSYLVYLWWRLGAPFGKRRKPLTGL